MTATDRNQPVGLRQKMLRFAILCVLFSVTACEPNGLYKSSDGERYLASIVEVGATIRETKTALSTHGIKVREITANDCGEAGNMWYDPKYVCEGGPALRLTLSENARPYNPFYSPTMNAFVAFDSRDSLISVTVMLEGGD